MGLFDIDYATFVSNLLPPQDRLPVFMAWCDVLCLPVQQVHDGFFTNYADGSSAPLWSSGNTYTAGEQTTAWYPFDANYLTTPRNIVGQSPMRNSVYECNYPGKWPALCPPEQDNGTGAVIAASMAGGSVAGVGIQSGGSGYGLPAQVFFIGGGGTGASASIQLDGNSIPLLVQVAGGGVSSVEFGQAQGTASISGDVMTVTAALGNFAVGQTILSSGTILPGTVITALGTGTGGTGTYIVNLSQTMTSSPISAATQTTRWTEPPVVWTPTTGGFAQEAQIIPILTNGFISGFNIVSPGTGYTSAVVGQVFGGTTVGPGTITGVLVTSPGSGYTEPPQAMVGSQWSLIAEDFRGATARAEYNDRLCQLTWELNEWFHTTFRPFSSPNGLYGWGTGNSATAYVSDYTGGTINQITIIGGGSGYIEPPAVFVYDPDGSGSGFSGFATLTFDQNTSSPQGYVSSITITNQGSGYTAPLVMLIGGGTATDQVQHSDIFITDVPAFNAFQVGFTEAESSNVVYASNEPTDFFPAYVPYSELSALGEFIIWIPIAYWNNLIAAGFTFTSSGGPPDVVKKFADNYVIAGVTYSVLPY